MSKLNGYVNLNDIDGWKVENIKGIDRYTDTINFKPVEGEVPKEWNEMKDLLNKLFKDTMVVSDKIQDLAWKTRYGDKDYGEDYDMNTIAMETIIVNVALQFINFMDEDKMNDELLDLKFAYLDKVGGEE